MDNTKRSYTRPWISTFHCRFFLFSTDSLSKIFIPSILADQYGSHKPYRLMEALKFYQSALRSPGSLKSTHDSRDLAYIYNTTLSQSFFYLDYMLTSYVDSSGLKKIYCSFHMFFFFLNAAIRKLKITYMAHMCGSYYIVRSTVMLV